MQLLNFHIYSLNIITFSFVNPFWSSTSWS